jgi:hypothetical protein
MHAGHTADCYGMARQQSCISWQKAYSYRTTLPRAPSLPSGTKTVINASGISR